MKNKKVHMTSLGCDKNTIDSQLMVGLIKEKNYAIEEDPKKADVIIVNTCCFIHSAKEESIDYILEYASYKSTGICTVLLVTGCMAERYHEELRVEIPEIDGFLGVGHIEKITKLLEESQNLKPSYTGEIDRDYTGATQRYIEDGTVTSFIRISEGCDHACTYCIIPKIRGRYRSRKSQDILNELSYLQKKGVKEIIIIGQDIAPYGMDLEEDSDLSGLLEKIARDFPFEWIRLLYLYPEGVTASLVAVVKKYPNICHYFDIPLQHTVDTVLKRMGRKMTFEKIKALCKLLRENLPDLVLRTTLITGFPGETEQDHQQLLKNIQELSFDHLGVFKYSQEETTPAASFPDQISEEIKEKRFVEIMKIQQKISLENNLKHCGSLQKVLIEEAVDDTTYLGRYYGDAPDIDGLVYVNAHEQALTLGDFYPVKIMTALEYDLIGDIENEFTK